MTISSASPAAEHDVYVDVAGYFNFGLGYMCRTCGHTEPTLVRQLDVSDEQWAKAVAEFRTQHPFTAPKWYSEE